ncbi:MAG: DUF4268 domain-containing protein [Paracoccaceae bacterium]
MTDITFGRLTDLAPREAWAHEQHVFTPWLAGNIDHLAEAIGIPLELTGTEVAVETFSADILARNPQDGGTILIENQLEVTDHTHLGQIMTYLAGLQAQTVVWIAPNFREPHLSAIRWLNEHTADGFSFFAVRLRVVRIGDSPYAPIFEVVEKPSNWERRLTERKREAVSGTSELGEQRGAFWEAFKARHPDAPFTPTRLSYFGVEPPGTTGITVCVWIGVNEGGIFVRGLFGEDRALILDRVAHVQDRLDAALGETGTARSGVFGKTSRLGGLREPETWPALIDWQYSELQRYLAAFTEILGEPA